MELLHTFIDFILHIDVHLGELMQQYGTLTYVILFAIIFCETGLVVTPFLPGDSLLFAAGALCISGGLNVYSLAGILMLATFLGDTCNYLVGRWVGNRVFDPRFAKIFKPKYLQKTQDFYTRYGAKTMILARFVPIVRTFAPFMAGVGKMSFGTFLLNIIIGGVLWINLFVFAGYFFGEIAFVKKNFSVVVMAIIFISLLPGIIEIIKARRKAAADRLS